MCQCYDRRDQRAEVRMEHLRLFKRSLPQLDLADVRELAERHYGLHGEFEALSGERDLNFRVTGNERRVAFKISNAADDEAIVDMQVAALLHVHARDPDLPIPRPVASKDGALYRRVDTGTGSYIVRAVDYLPGIPAEDAGVSRELWRATGSLLGRLNQALMSFHHPAAADNRHPWELAACMQYAPLTGHIGDGRSIVDAVFEHFERHTKPRLDILRHQVIHQDAHASNVLVDADDPATISGLIDFGDMLYGPVICDVAVACDVSAMPDGDLSEVLCEVTSGFDSTFALTEDDIDVLFDLVCARTALLATVVAARNALTPDEPAHVDSADGYITVLDRLLTHGNERCTRALRRACRFPAGCPATPGAIEDTQAEDELLAKRYRYMGRRTTHFYSRPLHFERASGVYLHATDGHRYLDCYNNVPQVGHCHPHVVRAISRQAAALNTNTRYLYSNVLEYAERLTATLAPHLDACLFVNSGSEANDVAWQMAQLVSGHSGALIMEDAYHGITAPIRAFSPGHPDVALPGYLQGLIVPDPYRGPYRDGDLASKYAADADRAIAALADDGHSLAACMIDSAFCSSGVPEVPAGYLQQIESRVRAAGGLMICDEVQSGFGRMGQWWGHEHHGVTADIVTLGKPVGNGHPLGVVVTSETILNAFIDAIRLFSTFGGNTVACAAGNAVLDVIEREDLIAQGRETGAYLRESLNSLAESQPLIGDIRGHGMLAGLEFVTDRDSRAPATAETARVLELMRERRVLVGSEGRDSNILKLRPSLVFERRHVDQFVEALDGTLTALNG